MSRFSCGMTMAAVLAASVLFIAPHEHAMASAQAPQNGNAATPPKPFLTFSSSGAESFLRSPKDAWILQAVRRMEAEGVQLPPDARDDFESDPSAAIAVALLRDLFTTRIAGSFALTPPEGGGPPMPEGQLMFLGNARRPGRSIEPTIIDALKLSGAWQGFQPDAARTGFRTFQPDQGPKAWFGSLDVNGGSATVISVGRPPNSELPDFARFGVAKGVEPQFSLELDFGPLQPYLGMASVMLPPGPDGRTALEQMGLISATPMILRVVGTNDGVDGRIDARLVNGAKAMAATEAARGLVLDASDLRWLPVDARSAWIGKSDLALMLNTTIDQFNAQAALFGDEEADFDDDMEGDDGATHIGGAVDAWVTENLGLDLRRDLVAPLGTFSGYQSSNSLGGGLYSSVLIIGLRDSATMKSSLDRLGTVLSGVEDARNAGVGLRARSHPGCDALYSLSLAGLPIPLQLVVGIGEGAMVIGFTPQSVVAAIAQATAKTTLLDNPGMKVMGGMGALKGANSVAWFDGVTNLRDGYGILLGLATALDSTLLPQGNATTPIGTIVPTLAELSVGAKPSLLVGRFDGDDIVWNYRCDGSFSVQTAALVGALGGIGTSYVAMSSAMLLPALAQARQAAEMARQQALHQQMQHGHADPAHGGMHDNAATSAELRMVGLGVATFAADNDDRLPASLDELVEGGYLSAVPMNRRQAPELTGAFVYRPSAPNMAAIRNPGRTAIAWEEFTSFPASGIAVLFVDGHVEQVFNEDVFKAVSGG